MAEMFPINTIKLYTKLYLLFSNANPRKFFIYLYIQLKVSDTCKLHI